MVGGVGEALLDLVGQLVHGPLALREHVDDLGATPVPERLCDRGERVEESGLCSLRWDILKLSLEYLRRKR
jgi:hypothetical protein